MAPATHPPVDEVDRLIAELNESSEGIGDEAQASLIALGPPAVERLVARVDGLSRFGKLCAIEVLSSAPVAGAGDALQALLADEDSTVREWAAVALGELGHDPAVEDLQRLRARLIEEAVPVDWTEPVAVRGALAVLGARHPVVPALLRQQAVTSRTGLVVWPASLLERLVEELSKAGQVLLYFMVWRQGDDEQLYGESHESAGWSFDVDAPWNSNVLAARDAALVEATALPERRNGLMVSMEWIDAVDVVADGPRSADD